MFRVFNDGSILIKDKTQIIVRDNGDIAFGNKPFNDLIYGEFKGIKLWGQSNEGVVLAGGGVKELSEISVSYKNITDAHTFLDKDGAIHFGSGHGITNAPSTHYYEMFGVTHSSRNWGFIIAKNIDVDDKTLYIKQIISGQYKDWFKLQSNEEFCKIKHLENVSSYNITLADNGKIFHVKGGCVFNYNTMPELCSISIRKVSDNGEITFVGSRPSISNGGDKLNGKKGSTAVIDYGLEDQIFIDFRNV